MGNSRSLAVVAMILAGSALILAVLCLWELRRTAAHQPAGSSTATEWLTGTPEERFLKIERQLRGLDQAMAEIGYRYGELLVAGAERNWEYAAYQTEKIDLSLKLALERRPKRSPSAQPFLNEGLPAVAKAIENKDQRQMDRALEHLHESCIACHQAENVLYFRDVVERIRSSATQRMRFSR